MLPVFNNASSKGLHSQDNWVEGRQRKILGTRILFVTLQAYKRKRCEKLIFLGSAIAMSVCLLLTRMRNRQHSSGPVHAVLLFLMLQ